MTKIIKKSLLKIKRRIFILGCIFCMMFSTVAFAKTYVGSVTSQSVSTSGIKITGNASYKYGIYFDKIYCYAAISGQDADSTIKSSPFNGVKVTPNASPSKYISAKVYGTGSYKTASASKNISTKNSNATVEFHIDGNCKKTYTLIGK